MTPLLLVLIGGALLAVSGVPGLLLGWRSSLSQPVATFLAVSGSIIGLAGSFITLFSNATGSQAAAWSLPGAAWAVEIDALGAFFLVPVFLVTGLGSIYGTRYWPQSEHPANGRRLRFFWGTLGAGMALLVLARNGILFLFGWEAMALSGFFLVGTEDHKAEVRQASWIYILATHVATLCLFSLFALFNKIIGSFALRPIAESEAGLGLLTVIFALMLVAFGLKAGLMPFHVWLPSAHANAPSHVSAILSGVVLKMGIYGFIRFLGYLPVPPASWGAFLLFLGVVSGVLGVAFALGQHDLKRLLAYHSVENIGIIMMGLGLAMLGQSLKRPEWILFGMAGCLLHVWNHSLFKSLLFLCAGPVVHAVRSREIDLMGGLSKSMPKTAALFLVGAVAICGLPPLNGFVSELFIYAGLFRTVTPSSGPTWASAALAAPCLALIGALALACFVKAYGAVFLGQARSEKAASAHEAPGSMIGPIILLAACCATIGLAPSLVTPLLEKIIAAWPGGGITAGLSIGDTLPLGWIGGLGAFLLALIALSSAVLLRRAASSPSAAAGTWDCGYARPTARMQYSSSSFAATIVGLFRMVLRPRIHRPEIKGLFPKESHFSSHVDDAVLEGFLVPLFREFARRISKVRVFQQGLVQKYIFYVLVTLLLLLLWLLPINVFIQRIFNR